MIVREGRVLMVRERNRGPTGRHDGLEFWTLPGGGVEAGESDHEAVRREVREEVGLRVTDTRPLYDFGYPSGHTSVFLVEVIDDEPTLGSDPDLDCDCPRMVGLDWVPVPPLPSDTGGLAIPTVIAATDIKA